MSPKYATGQGFPDVGMVTQISAPQLKSTSKAAGYKAMIVILAYKSISVV